jgi:hypothetical protein
MVVVELMLDGVFAVLQLLLGLLCFYIILQRERLSGVGNMIGCDRVWMSRTSIIFLCSHAILPIRPI